MPEAPEAVKESAEVAELREQLKPLFDNREELLAREEELNEQLDTIKEARKRIEKILRAGGLIEAYRPKDNGASNGNSKSNGTGVPSDAMVAIILEAAEGLNNAEFTIREVGEKTGKDLSTTKKCLEILRADHVVRLVGKKYPEGRSKGSKSTFYALMDN